MLHEGNEFKVLDFVIEKHYLVGYVLIAAIDSGQMTLFVCVLPRSMDPQRHQSIIDEGATGTRTQRCMYILIAPEQHYK